MEDPEIRRARERSKREIVIEESKPYLLCIFSSICFAGFNVVSKVSLDQGMSPFVLLVYSNAFGTLASAPLAFIFERKQGRKISLLVLRDVFFLGLLGMEKVEISKHSSQAKIVGTAAAFGVAALMSLYKGVSVISLGSLIQTQSSHNQSVSAASKLDKDWIKGSLLVFVSAFYVLQYCGSYIDNFWIICNSLGKGNGNQGAESDVGGYN